MKSRIVIAAVGAVMIALLAPAAMPAVYALDVPSTVEVLALTCGLEIPANNPASIDYGSLFPNQVSEGKVILFQNTGNTDGDVYFSGTAWLDGSDGEQMAVGATRFGVGGSAYDTKIALSTTPALIITLEPDGANNREFQVKTELINPGFTGALSQTVILAAEC
jgi:hypothetical protein